MKRDAEKRARLTGCLVNPHNARRNEFPGEKKFVFENEKKIGVKNCVPSYECKKWWRRTIFEKQSQALLFAVHWHLNSMYQCQINIRALNIPQRTMMAEQLISVLVSWTKSFCDHPHSISFNFTSWMWLSWGSVTFHGSSGRHEVMEEIVVEQMGENFAPKMTSWSFTVPLNGCRDTKIIQKKNILFSWGKLRSSNFSWRGNLL